VNPLLWFLPAYVANASATLSRLLPFQHPVDMGLFPGGRLLGDGKTFEGLLVGLLMGSATGLLLEIFGYHTPYFLLSVGALGGDMVGSFIKRRVGVPRGGDAFPLDQLDFVFGAFLLAPPDPTTALIIIIITPVIHRLANIIGFLIKVKREPW